MTANEGRRGRFLFLTAGMVSVLVAAGCGGGSSKPASSATTTAGSAGTTAASGATPTTASPANELNALSSSLASGKGATFKATYTGTTGTQSVTLTVEQKPPASLFSTGQGDIISTGKETYFCSIGAQRQCAVEQGASPIAALTQFISPASIGATLQTAEQQLAAHAAGYSISYSSGTYGGVASKCATVTSAGQTGTYCIGDNGILTHTASGAFSFSLTSFSTSVSSSDFALPSGASTVTIPNVSLPSGVTLPPGVTLPAGA